MAWVGWTHEETDAHHVFLSLKSPLIPLPQTSTLAVWSFPCKALHTLHWCNPNCSGSRWHMTWGGHSLPASIMLKRSPGSKIYWVRSSTIELLQRSLATWDSLAGRCCLYRVMEQYGLPVIGVVLVAPSIATSGGWLHFGKGHMGYEYSPIRSEVCLSQVTLQWETPPGMVMLPMTGVTLTPSGMVMLLIPWNMTPLSDGKDTLVKCCSTLVGGYTWHSVNCQPIHIE